MASSLGIHLRPDGFDYVLLEGSAKRWTVKDSGSGRLDPSAAPKSLGRTLSEGIRLKGKVDKVVLALPGSRALLREISLPFTDRDKVHQVLKFEVESELYHLDVDEVLADFLTLAGERATPTLLVTVLPKEVVREALDVAAGAGWDPPVVDVAYAALANAVAALDAGGTPLLRAAGGAGEEREDAEAASAADAPTAFLHVGSLECQLLIQAPDGALRAARVLPFGWREVLRGLEVAAATPAAEGEVLPPDADLAEVEARAAEEAAADEAADASAGADEGGGDDGDEEPHGRLFGVDAEVPLGPSLDEAVALAGPERLAAFRRQLLREVRRGLAAHPVPVARLGLLGDEVPGLEEDLAAAVGVPVARPDLGDAVAGACPIALGIGLRGVGVDRLGMNFRQEEFRYARGLERVEGPLTLALVGLIAFLVFDAGLHFKRARFLRAEADRIYRQADVRVEALNERVRADDEYPEEWLIRNDLEGLDVEERYRLQTLYNRVRAAKKDLDELMGESDLEMPPSALEAWRLLSEFLREEMADYPDRWMIESFDFTSVDARRSGSRESPAHVITKFGITLKGDDAERIAGQFDRLEQAFAERPWVWGDPAIPNTEPAKVGPGKTAIITVNIVPEAARAQEDQS